MTADQPSLQAILTNLENAVEADISARMHGRSGKSPKSTHREAIDAIYAGLLAELDLQDDEEIDDYDDMHRGMTKGRNILRGHQRPALKRWCYGENTSNG